MALSGVHIVCGYVGGRDAAKSADTLIGGPLAWSRTMTSPGITDLAATTTSPALGDPSFEIRSSFDIWFAWGPSPDATKASGDTRDTTRIFIPANETRNVFALPGDRAAWAAA